MFVWNHPIDVHYYTEVLQGWPKILISVFRLDYYGAKELCELKFFFSVFSFLCLFSFSLFLFYICCLVCLVASIFLSSFPWQS